MKKRYLQNRFIDLGRIVLSLIPLGIAMEMLRYETISANNSRIVGDYYEPSFMPAYILMFISSILVSVYSMHALFRIIKDAIEASKETEVTETTKHT